MEVVLLVLGITGIALLAMTRVIQRRSSSAGPATRGRRAPVVSKHRRPVAAATASTPVATWTPNPLADESGWDDDLGWEGVETAKPKAWEQWRESDPQPAPAEPVQESPQRRALAVR